MVETILREVELANQLNIKDARTVALVKQIAERTGESATQAVRVALEERAARLDQRREEKLERLRRIADEASKLWKPEFDGMELSTRHGELLYDEYGLPK